MLTLHAIANLPPETILWDEGKGSISGFGARRRSGLAVAYFVKYRTAEGRQRWHTLGRHGAPWTPDMARTEARRILGQVAAGGDPAARKQESRKGLTVAEVCGLYLAAAGTGRVMTPRGGLKKASTLATDKGRVERHIKPLLGTLKARSVTPADIERFRDAVASGATAGRIKTGKRGLARVTGGRGTATRTLALLGVIFSFAVKRGVRPDNPVHGVERHAYRPRVRRMSDDEYAALGRGLKALPDIWPAAIAAARFLAVTGWRRGEALSLKWVEVDLATRTARLADTKTGRSMRPLSLAACDVLRGLPRFGELVFPAPSGKAMSGFRQTWLRIAAQSSLSKEVTPHTLRHSFASIAADLGFSELTIAALLGHAKGSVTARYAHHAGAVLLQSADAVAGRIQDLMGECREPGTVVALTRDAR